MLDAFGGQKSRLVTLKLGLQKTRTPLDSENHKLPARTTSILKEKLISSELPRLFFSFFNAVFFSNIFDNSKTIGFYAEKFTLLSRSTVGCQY